MANINCKHCLEKEMAADNEWKTPIKLRDALLVALFIPLMPFIIAFHYFKMVRYKLKHYAQIR